MALWTGCVAGALADDEFIALLREVGFENPTVEPTRVYTEDDARALLANTGLDADVLAPQIEGRILSAFVRATKPGGSAARRAAAAESRRELQQAGGACCGPECCS
jgi:hypothetical protein